MHQRRKAPDKRATCATDNEDEFINLHLITKNLQSIRETSRFQDFITELDCISYDLMFLSETWRSETEESFETPRGDLIFLSGGTSSKGVGICVSNDLKQQMSKMSFHAISNRICILRFAMFGRSFKVFACYFPTCWDADQAVEELYEILSLFLDAERGTNSVILLGGDFNAKLGRLQASDDSNHVGPFGIGSRNDRRSLLARWIMSHNLQLLNRMKGNHDNWTCERQSDGMRSQIDFLLGQLHVEVLDAWNDFAIPIGIDHRCVHCCVRFAVAEGRRRRMKRLDFRGWMPHLDEFGDASLYHNNLIQCMRNTGRPTFQSVELVLAKAGLQSGPCKHNNSKFQPSPFLRQLRCSRRATGCPQERRCLSLQIRKLHAKEIALWKSNKCIQLLRGAGANDWRTMRQLQFSPKHISSAPPLDEFASMLSDLFRGTNVAPCRPAVLQEQLFNVQELKAAISSLKTNKACDKGGLAAELLHHAPHAFLEVLRDLYNHVFTSGDVPSTWRKTLFRMLAKHAKAKLVSDYRPIANVRLLYKVFAYMILHRIEPILESGQPEEQHGFRPNRRLEEHLLTANMIIDNTRQCGMPLWVLSLDLSKAFDRVDWPSLWQALRAHGVSEHIIWILQCLYFEQHGEVVNSAEKKQKFQHSGWSSPGMCSEPSVVLCGAGVGHARLEGPRAGTGTSIAAITRSRNPLG